VEPEVAEGVMDCFFVAVTLVFFAVALGYVVWCDRR
jgi:hypothetical protein